VVPAPKDRRDEVQERRPIERVLARMENGIVDGGKRGKLNEAIERVETG